MRDNFLNRFTTTYSLRPIADVGSVFRRYPGMWQVRGVKARRLLGRSCAARLLLLPQQLAGEVPLGRIGESCGGVAVE